MTLGVRADRKGQYRVGHKRPVTYLEEDPYRTCRNPTSATTGFWRPVPATPVGIMIGRKCMGGDGNDDDILNIVVNDEDTLFERH